MKRVFAISLLSIFLVSAAELYQLIKLPLLIEHFREHRNTDSSMTLWAFLCMHYDYAAKKDEDYAKDMTLPFKAHDTMIHSTISDFAPDPFQPVPVKTLVDRSVPFSIFDEHFINSSFLSTIWQPPKSC